MNDAGEGIALFKLVPAETCGKQLPDMGNTRSASGQKNRIDLRRQEA
jgi:hypothetical protein